VLKVQLNSNQPTNLYWQHYIYLVYM